MTRCGTEVTDFEASSKCNYKIIAQPLRLPVDLAVTHSLVFDRKRPDIFRGTIGTILVNAEETPTTVFLPPSSSSRLLLSKWAVACSGFSSTVERFRKAVA